MPVTVVVGAQWGDEGKGRIVDYLAGAADAVARFGGGANAGHTVRVGDKTYKLSMVPSGVIAGVRDCIIGPGTVVSLPQLRAELDELQAGGIDTSRVWLSDLAHLILPYHMALDQADETSRGSDAIGTTGKGIGPAYVDRAARVGLRAGDLKDISRCRKIIAARARTLAKLGIIVDVQAEIAALEVAVPRISPHVRDTVALVNELLENGKRVIAEGAQGTLLDVNLGSYPHVTSSVTVAGGAASGLGIGPWQIDHVIGVAKAYATRVGAGPFPTESTEGAGARLRERGKEYGVVTGRPRRCGWLDLKALRYSAMVNGLTHLALTKLDVLDEFDEVPVCDDYAGAADESLPLLLSGSPTPRYVTMAGWRAPISATRSWKDLPPQARAYIEHIEERANVPVGYVSVGPEREQIIVRPTAPIAPAVVST